jgi:hypothetical protein
MTLLLRLCAVQSSLIGAALWAQVAPSPAPAQPTPSTPARERERERIQPDTTAPDSPPADETVVLSPFQVVSDTRGYYSANTMSGTRFNTKLEDLASSISVVTKEQMADFGMLDINDVFLYSGNTEGTGTYTDFVVDRNGQVADNVQLNPTGANRVRGIAPANIAYGNFEVTGRMPVDPLIVDGIEISRGPNANVFGLGNASGTVNQVPVSANLTRNRTRAEFRVDSYEGWRTAIDVNHVLLRNKLAVRAGAAYQREEFERKPSGVNTTRYNAMVKYQPFKYTTVSGSFLHYRLHGNRPNFTPPRDNVSYWVASGRPSWNPTTHQYTLNGVTSAAFPNSNDTGVPDFFYRTSSMSTRGNIYIDQNGIGYWTAPYSTNATTPVNTSGGNPQRRLMLSSPGFGITGNNTGGRIGNQPLFSTTPVVSDKSIYDWSSINLSSVNRLRDEVDIYTLQLDQIFINTPRHTLVGQAAWFREDTERVSRTPIGNSGNSGVSGQLFVDVNSHNIDGTVNPYFGRTFIGVTEPRTSVSPARWDTYRSQLSYKLDLSQEESALKWLGTHQVSGYYEYKYRLNRNYTYRDVLSSEHAWTAVGSTGFAANQARGNQSNVIGGPQAGANIVRGFMRYYVGDANGNNVDYAPSDYAYGQYPFSWGNVGSFRTDLATLDSVASTDGTGANSNLKQTLKTYGAVVQSFLLDGKIVTTFGFRQDDVYSKNGATPQLAPGLTAFDYEATNHWAAGDYRFNSGKTKTAGVVARPFRDWSALVSASERNTGASRLFAQAVRGLSLTYNQSDTFLPQPPAVDLFLRPLPNITGEGKDYGFWINMLDGKLVVRVNRYDNKQLNARDGDANTVAQRVLRTDLDVSNETFQLLEQANLWVRANPAYAGFTEAQYQAEVERQTGLTTERAQVLSDAFRAGTIAATNDVAAKGTEIEVNFNPTRYWTVAASAEEKKAINSNVSTAVQQWIDQRMPIWTTVIDQSRGTPWWNNLYSGSQTPAQNFEAFVRAPYSIIKEQDGKAKPSTRRYSGRISTNYQLAGITSQSILKNVSVGGAVRWEDKGAIGYRGKPPATTGPLAGIYQELDPNAPIYDKDHWYFDAFIGYKTRLWRNKVTANFRLNCRNIQEGGRLQPIGVFPDGTPHSYRIVDPRIFLLTASFDL